MSSERSGRVPGSPRPQRSTTRVPSARSSSTQIHSASTAPRTPSPLTVDTTEVKKASKNPFARLEAKWNEFAEEQRKSGLGSQSRFSRSQSPTGAQRSRSVSPTGDRRSRSEPPRRQEIKMKTSTSITSKHSDTSDIPFFLDDSKWAQQLRSERSREDDIPGMANRSLGSQSPHTTRMMINFLDRDIRQQHMWGASRRERQGREMVEREPERNIYPADIGPGDFYLKMNRIIAEVKTYVLTASYCREDREQRFAYDHLCTSAQKMKELRILYNRCMVDKQPDFYTIICVVLDWCEKATQVSRRNVAELAAWAKDIHVMMQELEGHLKPLKKRYQEDPKFRKKCIITDIQQRGPSLQTARPALRPQPPPKVPSNNLDESNL